ncbi:hypothetical protein ILYODFUR_006661 [Ilyodon furcidens]|uniref:Uncharacterized protein n=1 Tax=Ilyodon furcidens TaxID=33524 RepID=A0ABV0USN3_9TELE
MEANHVMSDLLGRRNLVCRRPDPGGLDVQTITMPQDRAAEEGGGGSMFQGTPLLYPRKTHHFVGFVFYDEPNMYSGVAVTIGLFMGLSSQGFYTPTSSGNFPFL